MTTGTLPPIVADGRAAMLLDGLPIDAVSVRAGDGSWIATVALSDTARASFEREDTRSDATPSAALGAVLDLALEWIASRPNVAGELARRLQVELGAALDPVKVTAIVRAAVATVKLYRGEASAGDVLVSVRVLGEAIDAAGIAP